MELARRLFEFSEEIVEHQGREVDRFDDQCLQENDN
jgi:hypothetical protein